MPSAATSDLPEVEPEGRVVAARGPVISDGELVRRARTEDAWATEVLLRRHAAAIHALLFRLLQDPHDAEDAVQDTLILAVRDLAKLEDPEAFAAWIRRIAVNRAHRRFRRRRLARWLGARDVGGLERIASRDVPLEIRAELALLDRVLVRMSADLRTAWQLRHVEGFTLEEIADACECSLATVKRRLTRAQRLIVAKTNRGSA